MTVRKQDSLWRIHLKDRFGSRYIDEISVAEVNDYLAELYYKDGYAFKYVESFLKMFYLIFGQAYSRDYLGVDAYNKMCLNKDTKIHMPKLKVDDDTDIVVFTREETVALDKYFEGTNAETAYLLGCFCGLRINEAFGLKWSNVNLEDGTITIDRQMQYQDRIVLLAGFLLYLTCYHLIIRIILHSSLELIILFGTNDCCVLGKCSVHNNLSAVRMINSCVVSHN